MGKGTHYNGKSLTFTFTGGSSASTYFDESSPNLLYTQAYWLIWTEKHIK